MNQINLTPETPETAARRMALAGALQQNMVLDNPTIKPTMPTQSAPMDAKTMAQMKDNLGGFGKSIMSSATLGRVLNRFDPNYFQVPLGEDGLTAKGRQTPVVDL